MVVNGIFRSLLLWGGEEGEASAFRVWLIKGFYPRSTCLHITLFRLRKITGNELGAQQLFPVGSVNDSGIDLSIIVD